MLLLLVAQGSDEFFRLVGRPDQFVDGDLLLEDEALGRVANFRQFLEPGSIGLDRLGHLAGHLDEQRRSEPGRQTGTVFGDPFGRFGDDFRRVRRRLQDEVLFGKPCVGQKLDQILDVGKRDGFRRFGSQGLLEIGQNTVDGLDVACHGMKQLDLPVLRIRGTCENLGELVEGHLIVGDRQQDLIESVGIVEPPRTGNDLAGQVLHGVGVFLLAAQQQILLVSADGGNPGQQPARLVGRLHLVVTPEPHAHNLILEDAGRLFLQGTDIARQILRTGRDLLHVFECFLLGILQLGIPVERLPVAIDRGQNPIDGGKVLVNGQGRLQLVGTLLDTGKLLGDVLNIFRILQELEILHGHTGLKEIHGQLAHLVGSRHPPREHAE